jgi:hypothetical protein
MTPAGEVPIPISIDAPTGDKQVWSCSYEIGWPAGGRRGRAHGVDALQALYQALKLVGRELYTSNEHRDGRLRCGKANDGYGFPVPKNLRGLLVGNDKMFDG